MLPSRPRSEEKGSRSNASGSAGLRFLFRGRCTISWRRPYSFLGSRSLPLPLGKPELERTTVFSRIDAGYPWVKRARILFAPRFQWKANPGLSFYWKEVQRNCAEQNIKNDCTKRDSAHFGKYPQCGTAQRAGRTGGLMCSDSAYLDGDLGTARKLAGAKSCRNWQDARGQ